MAELDQSCPKLFIDGSNITYIAYFGAEKASDPQTAFARIYKGLTDRLENEHPFHEMIFAWEGTGNSIIHRLALHPGYKSNRIGKKSTREFRDIAKAYNETQGWKNVSLHETEADDIIYALANLYKETKSNNLIISADHDFIQIVQEGLAKSLYSLQTKKFVTIPEHDIVLFKAMAGDASDCIPGIVGCGPKTALKYMENGVPPEHFETVGKFFKVVSMKNYSEEHNTFEQVKQLLTCKD